MDFIKLASLVLAATLAAPMLTGCNTRQPTDTGVTPVPTLEITDTDIEPLDDNVADTETDYLPAAIAELAVLADKGLISQSIADAGGVSLGDGSVAGEFVRLRIASPDSKYNGYFFYNIKTGKIDYFEIEATADGDDVPVRAEAWDGVEYSFYDNYGDIFDTALTVDGFCQKLAGYWGYTGYTLRDTHDEFYNMDWSAVDGGSLLADLPQDNYYLTVMFENGDETVTMYVQTAQFPDRVCFIFGGGHMVG